MQDNRFMNASAAQAASIDVGLRAYMLGVYNHMTTALALTGFRLSRQNGRFYQCQVLVNYFSDHLWHMSSCLRRLVWCYGSASELTRCLRQKRATFLRLCRHYGYFAVNNIASLYRLICCTRILYYRRGFCRPIYLWLHNKA